MTQPKDSGKACTTLHSKEKVIEDHVLGCASNALEIENQHSRQLACYLHGAYYRNGNKARIPYPKSEMIQSILVPLHWTVSMSFKNKASVILCEHN